MDYRPTSCYFVASVNSGDGHQVIRTQGPAGQKNIRDTIGIEAPPVQSKKKHRAFAFQISCCRMNYVSSFWRSLPASWQMQPQIKTQRCCLLPESRFMEWATEAATWQNEHAKKWPHAHTPPWLSNTDINYYLPHAVASAEISFGNCMDACVLQEVIQERWGKSTLWSPTNPFDLLAPGVLPTLNSLLSQSLNDKQLSFWGTFHHSANSSQQPLNLTVSRTENMYRFEWWYTKRHQTSFNLKICEDNTSHWEKGQEKETWETSYKVEALL